MKPTLPTKRILFLFSFLLSIISITSSAQTTYYWVGNGGDWKDSHWALTSGGVATDSLPTINDDVIFDANSFTLPGQVVTITDDTTSFGVSFHTMDWRGVTNMPTFRIDNTVSDWISNDVGGSLYLDPNMIVDFDNAEFYFGSMVDYDLDLQGHHLGFNCYLSINYSWLGGGYSVTCNLLSGINNALIYLDKGTLVSNGHPVVGQADPISSANYIWVRNSSVADFSNSIVHAGQLNITESGSIIDNNATIYVHMFLNGNGQDFENIIISDSVVMNAPAGNNTFQSLTIEPGALFALKNDSTQTVNNLIANGTQAAPITLKSRINGTQARISKSTGEVHVSYAHIRDIHATGGAVFKAWNSWDDGNNTGWIFLTASSDSIALVNLYNSLNGPGWHNKAGWLTANVKDWYGITVEGGRVTQINLSNNNLSGAFPASIVNLTALHTLFLDGNNISGALPGTIGNLTNLASLNLDNNNLTGTLPVEIGALDKIIYISLGGNNFSGPLPIEIGDMASLELLYLWGNNFTGGFPVELTNAQKLKVISLSGNQLTGAIPAEITTLDSLQDLDIQSNFFTDLPDLSSMTNLGMKAYSNYFTFEDIIPNMSLTGFGYNYQRELPLGDTISVTEGAPLSLSVTLPESDNVYQWKKEWINIAGATTSSYDVDSASVTDAGYYFVVITNPSVPSLTLQSTPFFVDIAAANANEDSGYTFWKKLGAEAIGAFQHSPQKMTAGASGTIYAQDALSGRINKFNSAGDFLLTVNQTTNFSDLEVDENDALYVSDEVSNTVKKYDASGNLIFEIQDTGGSYGVAIDTAGNIIICPRNLPDRFKVYNSITGVFITDIMFTASPNPGIYLDIEAPEDGSFYAIEASIPRLDKFSNTGEFVQSFDLQAAGLTAWNGWDFEVASNGDVLIINGSKVFRFDAAGNLVNQFANITSPWSTTLAIVPSGILVGESMLGFSLYNTSGTYIDIVGPKMNAPGQFLSPTHIVMDKKGYRYISDTFNHRIQKFTADGTFVSIIGSEGSGTNQLLRPRYLAVDNAGDLYVSDAGNNRIQKFSIEGSHLSTIGVPGTADGQLLDPRGIAISKSGFLYVLDGGNNRIQKFTTAGAHVQTFGDTSITNLSAIAIEHDGTLAVINNFPTKILRFNEAGEYLGETKLTDQHISNLSSDNSGSLYISVSGNITGSSIRKISKTGSVITKIGTAGKADGQIDWGYAVSSNADGDTVWVASNPNRISIFYANFGFATAADSTALVDLYNSTNGAAWNNNANWLTGTVDTWYGVTMRAGKIRSIKLAANNLEGAIPLSIGSLNELDSLDLSLNSLADTIPDLSAMNALTHLDLSHNRINGNVPFLPAQLASLRLNNNELSVFKAAPDYLRTVDVMFNNLTVLGNFSGKIVESLHVEENKLTFEDLEPNIAIPAFTYIPQDSVGERSHVVLEVSDTVTFHSNQAGTANLYQWFKDGIAIASATGDSLTLNTIQLEDDAFYNVHITNATVPGLTLKAFETELRISSIIRDSLALIKLFNDTKGPSWVSNNGWIDGPLNSWEGIILENNRVTEINLSNNNLDGTVPFDLLDMLSLDTINIADNAITAIPDFTSLTKLNMLDVSGNKLDFGSLISNAAIAGIDYSNQAKIGVAIDSLVDVGSDYEIQTLTPGAGNVYTWKRNGEVVDGAVDSVYLITSINRNNMGEYVAEVTNPAVANLTLTTHPQKIFATASISGTLMIDSTAATAGDVVLMRITEANGYDTTAIQSLNENGSFLFEKVILADYQLLGFADTLVYEKALPTYYSSTIFWEEADTIVLQNHIDSLTIISELEPEPPSGHGVISGYLQEDDGLGGRRNQTLANKRVENAGVSARKVERTGRSKEEKLTLVAYEFTNANGEFAITNLPEGDYRLNIQYPGYPMDTTSFTTITIGNALQSLVQVEANVVDGKISVRKLLITEVFAIENYSVELYPNPAVESINLVFGKTHKDRNITMMDLNGKSLLVQKAEQKAIQVNVQTLNKGLYLMHIQENGMIVKTMKVSIE